MEQKWGLIDDENAKQAATYGNKNVYKGIKKGYSDPHIIGGPASTARFFG